MKITRNRRSGVAGDGAPDAPWCTDDSYWVSIKTHKPIASVAALPAQPLAALPPYGCGVPLAGTERLVQGNSTASGRWCIAAHPDVSLRGAKRRGNLGKALPIYTECRRTQSLSNLTVAALSERHGGLQYAPHCLYGARLSDLSLRGAKRRGNLTQPVTYSPGLTCYSAYPTSLPQAVFSFPSI